MRIDEQIVLVTGGARGLGVEIARAFAREGARVVVNYRRSEAAATDLVRELGAERAVALRADVTDDDEVRALVRAAGDHFGAPITTGAASSPRPSSPTRCCSSPRPGLGR
ncbi:MAG: SDR family NAD(P)-dependent oxidoreductase [Dietzia sp.]